MSNYHKPLTIRFVLCAFYTVFSIENVTGTKTRFLLFILKSLLTKFKSQQIDRAKGSDKTQGGGYTLKRKAIWMTRIKQSGTT